ncbi:MAG: DNA/RNA non-specific endonuclease [Treponema sp.]|nr:DNA/RNA non-specific endonuclease [Treponema sp.]
MKINKYFYHEPHEPTRKKKKYQSIISCTYCNVRIRIFSWLIIFLVFFSASSFACDLEGHFLFTVSNSDEEVLYWGCYDAINSGPHIIEYILTKERAEATGIRRPSVPFTQDRDGGLLQELLLENGFSLPHHNDLTHSGYDRGHMAPNADFNDTYENALMTFFIANIWPQTPNVNRVTWLRTENETRRLASEYLFVRVIIIVDEFSGNKIGAINIPSCFKRRVYDLNSGELIYEIDIYQ